MARSVKKGKPTEVVLHLLREHGLISNAQLARLSGLGKATISRAVKELRDSGLIVPAQGAAIRNGQNAGRPATGLRLNPESGLCIGVAFGPRHIGVILADVSHTVISHEVIPMVLDYPHQAGVVAAKGMIESILATNGNGWDRVLGIGVAVGAPVDPRTGRVIRSSLIPSWSGVAVRDLFQMEPEIPVFVDNASNCSALAELMWGSGRGRSNVLFIHVDHGLGGAVIIDGNIQRGHAGGAGEIGHITFDPHGPLCRCGNRGCYELYASLPALRRQLTAIVDDRATFDDIVSLARAGDAGVQRILNDMGEVVGRLAGFVGNVLDPELVIIGGAFARAGDLFMNGLTSGYRRHALMYGRTDSDGQAEFALGMQPDLPELGAVGLVLKPNDTIA
jgi:predicted NBD/HSP70 family sugar kinase/biotin operon repressor